MRAAECDRTRSHEIELTKWIEINSPRQQVNVRIRSENGGNMEQFTLTNTRQTPFHM